MKRKIENLAHILGYQTGAVRVDHHGVAYKDGHGREPGRWWLEVDYMQILPGGEHLSLYPLALPSRP